ncbi:MAG: universal stress protein [Pirellulales bacterium]|nr:universal stress protein [Pirellulales bacterium]
MAWIPKKRVVVPFDFSDQSIRAVQTGLDLVDDPANLFVVHVLPELVPTEPGVIWTTVDDKDRQEHATEAIHARLSEAKYKGIHMHAEIGDPGHAIADYAQNIDAELIVMPSHGRTGLSRLLIGSVAERVVRLAHCPVLVLRGLEEASA